MTFLEQRRVEAIQRARDSQFEELRDIVTGYIITKDGSIEGDREGYIWFQAQEANSQPRQVFYDGNIGDIRSGMRVKIERDPKEPARWGIIGIDRAYYFDDVVVYETLPAQSNIPAKTDYEWPPGYPGKFALNLSARQITQFAVRPTKPASMKVRVYSGFYAGTGGTYTYFQGPKDTEDLTARVPGTAGLARLVSISIDNSGAFQYVNGNTFPDNIPMPTSAYPAASTSHTLVSSVKLVNGMTSVTEANFINEMRPLFASGAADGTVKVSEIWESDFGSEALQSDASGNIGIGNASPQKLLHVGAGADSPTTSNDGIYASNAGTTSVIVRNSTDDIENILHVSTTQGVIGTVTNHDLTMRTNNVDRLTIQADGDVGIGTTSPSHFVDITNSSTNWRLRLNGTGTDSVVSLGLQNDARSYLITVDGSASDIFKIRDATAGTDRIILNSSGNVGIGATPQSRFHTYGAISGWMRWEYDGVDATVRTIIPDGTGDVLYTCRFTYVMRGSGGTIVGNSVNVDNGASTNVTVGSNTVRLRVNANGSADIARTAGSNTIKVGLALLWL